MQRIKKAVVLIILIIVAITMLIPFYWMFVLATQSSQEIYSFPPRLFFSGNLLNNMKNMSNLVNIGRGFLNSLLVSGVHTVLVLLFCSMGGYAFAKFEFPGKKVLFAIIMATMMIPGTASIVPWFFMMAKIGWVNNYLALIIPGCANAFGIFWMRQYCTNNVPSALIESATIDGCNRWLIFFRVVVPIIKPAYATLGIITFINSWNEFMNAMLILRKPEMQTIPLLLSYLTGDPVRGNDMGAMMVANALAVLPLLIIFLFASNFFIQGLTAGAVKE